MRWLGWMLFSLTVAGWVACELPTPATPSAPAAAETTPVRWRRTQNGWEGADGWQPHPTDFFEPTLHPATVAALMGLLSVLALSALPGSHRPEKVRPGEEKSPAPARISPPQATN